MTTVTAAAVSPSATLKATPAAAAAAEGFDGALSSVLAALLGAEVPALAGSDRQEAPATLPEAPLEIAAGYRYRAQPAPALFQLPAGPLAVAAQTTPTAAPGAALGTATPTAAPGAALGAATPTAAPGAALGAVLATAAPGVALDVKGPSGAVPATPAAFPDGAAVPAALPDAAAVDAALPGAAGQRPAEQPTRGEQPHEPDASPDRAGAPLDPDAATVPAQPVSMAFQPADSVAVPAAEPEPTEAAEQPAAPAAVAPPLSGPSAPDAAAGTVRGHRQPEAGNAVTAPTSAKNGAAPVAAAPPADYVAVPVPVPEPETAPSDALTRAMAIQAVPASAALPALPATVPVAAAADPTRRNAVPDAAAPGALPTGTPGASADHLPVSAAAISGPPQPPATAPPVPIPVPAGFAAQLSRPVVRLASAGPGEHTITVAVNPENLGPVTVQAHISAAGVRVELFAAGPDGRDALRQILPDLKRDLAGSGLNATLDLSSGGQPGGQGGRDEFMNRRAPDAYPGATDNRQSPMNSQASRVTPGLHSTDGTLDVMA